MGVDDRRHRQESRRGAKPEAKQRERGEDGVTFGFRLQMPPTEIQDASDAKINSDADDKASMGHGQSPVRYNSFMNMIPTAFSKQENVIPADNRRYRNRSGNGRSLIKWGCYASHSETKPRWIVKLDKHTSSV